MNDIAHNVSQYLRHQLNEEAHIIDYGVCCMGALSQLMLNLVKLTL